jgi:hypothetical protein
VPDKIPAPDQNLQQEFNRWAEAGEGEKMATIISTSPRKPFA